jgi:hypothetical protein
MITVCRGTICGCISGASERHGRPTPPVEQELSNLIRGGGVKESGCVGVWVCVGEIFPKKKVGTTGGVGVSGGGRGHEGSLHGQIWAY